METLPIVFKGAISPVGPFTPQGNHGSNPLDEQPYHLSPVFLHYLGT